MDSNQVISNSISQSSIEFREIRRNEGPGFVKKRKQSLDGSECETLPSDRRDSLQESFSALNLNGKRGTNKALASPRSDRTLNLAEEEDQADLKVPKPLKLGQLLPEITIYQSTQGLPNHNYRQDEFLKTLINITNSDAAGVSKYLDLDLNTKIKTIEQTTSGQEKKASLTAITSFFNSAYSSPFAAFTMPLNNTFKEEISKSFVSPFTNIPKTSFENYGKCIGPLTREERMKKVNKYLEKKSNRNWKQIRYSTRKDLAEKRQRVQGRFVKSKLQTEMEDIKHEELSTNNNSFVSQVKTEEMMDSEFARNNLSDSYSSFRRSILSDN